MDEKLVELLRLYSGQTDLDMSFDDPRTFLDRNSVDVISKSIVDIIVDGDKDGSVDCIDEIGESLAGVVQSWCRPARSPDVGSDEAFETALGFVAARGGFNIPPGPSDGYLEDYIAVVEKKNEEKVEVYKHFESSVDQEFQAVARAPIPVESDRQKALLDLGYALTNSLRMQHAPELLDDLVRKLDVDISKRLLTELYENELVSKRTRESILDRVPIVMQQRVVEIVDRIADVDLDVDSDYNRPENFDRLVGTVYETAKNHGLVELCEQSAASRPVFERFWKFLGVLFAATRYDFRVLALMRNCVIVIEHLFEYGRVASREARFDDLFGRRELVFKLGFEPDVLAHFPDEFDETLAALDAIHDDDPFECMVYLCRFLDWRAVFVERLARRTTDRNHSCTIVNIY